MAVLGTTIIEEAFFCISRRSTTIELRATVSLQAFHIPTRGI
jgi:hypothetical protein